MKKTARVLLVLLMIFSMFTSTFNVQVVEATCTLNLTSATKTGNRAADIVAVAQKNLNKTGRSVGATENWCADFVWRCADLAGISSSVIPHTGAVDKLYSGVISGGGTIVSSAQKGDLVFYTSGSSYCHVGLMIDANNSIQGNMNGYDEPWYSNSKVMQCVYTAYNGGSFKCFVRPNYHSWSSWKTTKSATCTAAGSRTRTCSSCGKKETQTIKALGHTYKHYTTAAKIGIKGNSYDKCTRCGNVKNKVEISALKPATTNITSLKAAKGSIDVSWTKKSYSGYQVRYSLNSNMSSSTTVSVPKASTTRAMVVLKSTAKKTYYVQVRTYQVVNEKNVYSDWSAKKSIKTK